jgi:hypothetical protein
MSDQPHIMIATPCYGGQMTMAYVDSVLRIQAACIELGISLTFKFRANEALIVRARNDMVADFLKSKATHLLFIDADIGFKPEHVFRLLHLDAEVAGAAYPLKQIDWTKVQRAAEAKRPNLESSSLDYVVYWEGNKITGRNGFARVRYAGTGFLMLKRSALVRLCAAHPELKYKAALRKYDLGREDLDQFSLFECMIDQSTGEYLSEDYAFCRRWTDLGGEYG